MKTNVISLFTGLVTFCAWLPANAQEYKEHVSKEFSLPADASKQVISIYNLDGFIKVEGYSGNKVVIEIDETISADDKATVEAGKKEFKLAFDQNGDSLTAYIAEPYDSRPRKHWRHYDGDREIDYRYHLEFTVKVPYVVNLNVSTVNDGKISIKDVTGALHVNNVNEAISITNAKGTTYAHTVNGGVEVTYAANPPGQNSYYTINGEIKVSFKNNLSADLQFKSMNGEFFTDFQNTEILPAQVTKNQESHGGSTIYKLNRVTSVRIGSGGQQMKFETLNGNIYIKSQS